MAVGLYQVVAQLAKVSGVPQDTIENVFHFWQDSAVPSITDDVDAINAWLLDFYNTTPSGGATDLANYLGTNMSRVSGANKFAYYHKPNATFPGQFGSPVDVRSWTLDAAQVGSANLPCEVAAVLSFHGDLTDIPETAPDPDDPDKKIRPAARRRGRLYLGCLLQAASANDGNNDPLLSSGLRNVMNGIAVDLMAAPGANEPSWVVWSREDSNIFEVVGGFINFDYDTQRRRGTDAGTRTLFP